MLMLLLACALGSREPAAPDTRAAAAVANIARAGDEAREVAALAARVEALSEELRVGSRPREEVLAELRQTLDTLEVKSGALDAQLELVRGALSAPE